MLLGRAGSRLALASRLAPRRHSSLLVTHCALVLSQRERRAFRNTKLFHTELQGRTIETIPAETMDFFIDYAGPGNIRELQNLIERAVILPSWP